MKKFFKYLIVFFLILLFAKFSHCQQSREITDQKKSRIVIMHPDVSSLKSFINLFENKIINIPNYELIAVVYAEARNDFDILFAFLEENDYSNIHLQKIDGELNQGNLFIENPCSEDFYRIFKNSDGLFSLGGADTPPAVYGQKTNLLSKVRNPYRHYFEISFLFHLLGGSQNKNFLPYMEENPEYVIYGFCLGMQLMNIATGGTLYQDIPSEIYGLKYVDDVLKLDQDFQHSNYWTSLPIEDELMWFHLHRIKFAKNQFFVNNLKMDINDFPYVPSAHHQAVKKLGKGLKVAATSMDGKIVEALTHKKYKNVLGVQYHPEGFDLYSLEGEQYKIAPDDTVCYSYNEILKEKNSLGFHKRYWGYFSTLFQK